MSKNYFFTAFFSVVLLTCISIADLTAQTTLISPTGDGGFESGTTFAANNWNVTTSGATNNQWTCSTGATAGFSGTRCAYVTNNTAGSPPPHAYTNTSASAVSHIYRNVTVPAGQSQITLTFNWMANGESTYDYMRVWLVPTSYTPTYGTSIFATGTVPTGQIQAGLTYYNLQGSWTSANISLPTAYAGTTFRLVFEWTNDGSLGTMPPIALDNISLVSQMPVAPANDNCAAATVLAVSPTTTCSTSTNGTTMFATQSQTGCQGNADDDVWYRFVATSTAHTVTVTPGTLSDAVLQVFSGSCGSLTSMACVDANGGASTETTTLSGLTVGNTYFARVYSYSNGSNQGTFSICVTTPPTPPSNDACTGATALTVNPALTCSATTSGTTIAATQSLAGCGFSTADDDVWYSFVATSTSHNVTVTPGTLSDAVFQVFSGTCAGLTSLACIDGSGGSAIESATVTGLTVGNTYYVRVYSYSGAGNQGTFSICVTTPVPLTNDNCATATTLTVNATTSCTVTTGGTTIGASQSMAGCAGTADDDVWYSFVATSNTHNVTVTPGTLYDAVFQVFGGSCGSLTPLACIDNTISTLESATVNGLTVGNTYFVRVYSYSGTAGNQGTFTICIGTDISCTGGSSAGVTDLGCPNVVSGGLGLNGADPAPIACTSAGCVDLEATYLQLGQPTTYTVQSIPYAPPYQFGCLANPVSVNNDDVWSPVINLPFNFCFYGNTYNQCLMSSNGVISFDMVNNTPGGPSEWEFETNLPDNTLFLNSIFGVHHDIDPREGGEVGWELITLNTGCRALVAAWSNIPMYSSACNSQLYSGMVVLYENTNIIDVYIQEKNVCSSWNDGNAIVGIQNATGTLAAVAPGRNGLDANWSVINEAWRFVPAGTSITSLKWYEGVGTTGPVVGTTDVINVCPAATTVYTAEITYTLCNGTTIKETENTTVNVSLSKVWNGSVDTDWNVANNWSPPGVPTDEDCVVVPDTGNDPVISGGAFDAYAYSLRVLNGGLLTLDSTNNLTVTNIVNVTAGGTFNIQDDASLLQIDPVANVGIVNMQRITTPLYRFDYTYWNSPMTLSSNYTLGMLSQNLTQYDKYYHWTPSVGNGTGNWAQESAATVMDPTKGYIVRAPNTFSFTPTAFTPYTATFTGTPNNGDVNCPISFGTDATTFHDQWNLIGNPYPSAVSSLAFVTANSSVIDGTLFFWTHNSAISSSFPDPFYNDFVLNYTSSDYAAWNATGGTAASSGGAAPDDYIATAQSFFVLATGTPGNATFTNAMRVKNNNSQFFRPGSIVSTSLGNAGNPFERHRLWLNMTNNHNAFSQILVGYVDSATLGYDGLFDGQTMNQGNVNFYSVIPDRQLVIQGRPLPFDINDQVPLGYNTATEGTYAIRIDHFDELFQQYNIYVEDKLLNIVHDLKASPYSFTTEAGTFDARFVLRYTTTALHTGEVDAEANTNAFVRNNELHVRASEPIASVEVFDLTGKAIRKYKSDGALVLTEDFNFEQSVYMARITLENGMVAIRKLRN